MEEIDDVRSALSQILRDTDGFPIPGKVVKLFRERKRYIDVDGKEKHWTQEDLARALGISKLMVKRMENHNQGLDSFERRKLLCAILNIPPALLGLATIDQIDKLLLENKPFEKAVPALLSGIGEDRVVAYKTILQDAAQQQIQHSALPVLGEIESVILSLNRDIRNARDSRKKRDLLYVKWEFDRLAAKIYGDDKHSLYHANKHLNNALQVAVELKDANLLAITHMHSCGVKLHLQNSPYLAKPDIDAALSQLKNVSPIVACDIQALASHVYHATASDLGEAIASNRFLERSQNIISGGIVQDDRYAPGSGVIRCKTTQFGALFSMRRIPETMSLLDEINRSMTPEDIRNLAINSLRLAKCYIAIEAYEMAVPLLTDALATFKTIKRQHSISEVRKLYRQLQVGPYANHPDLAELEIALHEIH